MKLPIIEMQWRKFLHILHRVCVTFYKMWWSTPWYKAFITTALKKYIESSWYRDRLEIGFRKRQVIDMFFDRDMGYFKWKITRKEKLGIFFVPYNYIQRTKLAVTKAGLADYL